MAIRMSNNVMIVLNLVTLLLSVPILASGVWLRSRADDGGTTECDHFHFLSTPSTPAIALGAALAAVSLAGLAGACCRATWLLFLHLLAMLALIVALLCFTAFAFAFAVTVTTNNNKAAVSSGPATGYRLGVGAYSTWLRRHVEGRDNWARIRSCLAGARVCRRQRLEESLSGCCRPPTSCNFTHAGGAGTEWANKKTAAAAGSADPDCGAWGDDELCYGCRSCKAGVVDALRRDWKRAAVVGVVVLALVVVVYSVGCCAFGNSRRDNYAYHSGRGWKRSGDA